MGNVNSNREKLRTTIVLKLHHLLPNRTETLEHLLLDAFTQYDQSATGTVRVQDVQFVCQLLGIQLHKECYPVMQYCEDLFDFQSDGLFHYVQFLSYLFPLHTIKCKTLNAIGLFGIYPAFQGFPFSVDNNDNSFILKCIDMKPNATEMASAIRNKISILQTYHHFNLLQYIGTYTNEVNYPNHFYIVQEWVDNICSLKTILTAFGPMSESTIRRYLVQVLYAIQYLQSHHILHKEIRGHSIYIDSGGLVKLGEFGIIKELNQLSSMELTPGHSIYDEYPPPETVNSTRWGKKSDIWCIGLLAIEMANGTMYVKSKQTQGQSKQILYPPIIPSEASELFQSFLFACFDNNPVARFTIDQLIQHPFFQSTNCQDDTNRMLSEVCTSLDLTMKKLNESIPSPVRRVKINQPQDKGHPGTDSKQMKRQGSSKTTLPRK